MFHKLLKKFVLIFTCVTVIVCSTFPSYAWVPEFIAGTEALVMAGEATGTAITVVEGGAGVTSAAAAAAAAPIAPWIIAGLALVAGGVVIYNATDGHPLQYVKGKFEEYFGTDKSADWDGHYYINADGKLVVDDTVAADLAAFSDSVIVPVQDTFLALDDQTFNKVAHDYGLSIPASLYLGYSQDAEATISNQYCFINSNSSTVPNLYSMQMPYKFAVVNAIENGSAYRWYSFSPDSSGYVRSVSFDGNPVFKSDGSLNEHTANNDGCRAGVAVRLQPFTNTATKLNKGYTFTLNGAHGSISTPLTRAVYTKSDLQSWGIGTSLPSQLNGLFAYDDSSVGGFSFMIDAWTPAYDVVTNKVFVLLRGALRNKAGSPTWTQCYFYETTGGTSTAPSSLLDQPTLDTYSTIEHTLVGSKFVTNQSSFEPYYSDDAGWISLDGGFDLVVPAGANSTAALDNATIAGALDQALKPEFYPNVLPQEVPAIEPVPVTDPVVLPNWQIDPDVESLIQPSTDPGTDPDPGPDPGGDPTTPDPTFGDGAVPYFDAYTELENIAGHYIPKPCLDILWVFFGLCVLIFVVRMVIDR